MHTVSSEDQELDLRVRLGLLGSPPEREQAIDLLFSRFQRPVMKFLADRFTDLDADDRASALHDAFAAVYSKAEDGTLDVDSPLHSLLFTVANRKAIDLRRRASCRIRADVELTEEVGDYLVGTETGRDWSLAVVLGRTTEAIGEFRQFVTSLKGQQKRVASVMADFLPDWLTDQEIADEVFIRAQRKTTVMEVKGAKNALMTKFRTILKRKVS